MQLWWVLVTTVRKRCQIRFNWLKQVNMRVGVGLCKGGSQVLGGVEQYRGGLRRMRIVTLDHVVLVPTSQSC